MKVMVIGAGFAGLAAALRLRLAGADVTVLDALEAPGGKAALGWPDVSSGPTVVTMPQVFRALHGRLSLPAPELSAASPVTTYRSHDGRVFAPEALSVTGQLSSTLAQLSPTEARDYERLLFAARRMYDGAASTFIFNRPPGLPDLARYGLRHGLGAAPGVPLRRFVQSGPFLTPFWLRFATYLGANPYRAPAVLHNVAWVELGGGVWHLRGGLLGFARTLHGQAQRLGVAFEFGARVEALHAVAGRVRAAHTSRGVFTADAWVSAADHHFTGAWLGKPVQRPRLGVSGFALQLRLEGHFPPSHHVFWPQEYAREWRDIASGRVPRDPTLYLHVDGERAFLLVNAPPGWTGDTAGYAAFLLNELHKVHPLPVTEYRVLSPAEYARTGLGGALYGSAPHGLTGSLRPGWDRHGLVNLRQVGGTVFPGGGVPLSLLSGWNGAGELLGLEYDALGGPE